MTNLMASAKLVRDYFKIIDGNPEDPEYHIKVRNFKSVVTTKFDNYYSREDNPVVSLFLTLIKFEESSLDLDFMGLEHLANDVDTIKRKVNENLRAVVEQLLDGEISHYHSDHDVEFVSRVAQNKSVLWIENYRNRHKYIVKR